MITLRLISWTSIVVNFQVFLVILDHYFMMSNEKKMEWESVHAPKTVIQGLPYVTTSTVHERKTTIGGS